MLFRSSSEETASSSEELSGRAENLKNMINRLKGIIDGANGNANLHSGAGNFTPPRHKNNAAKMVKGISKKRTVLPVKKVNVREVTPEDVIPMGDDGFSDF